MPAATGEAFYSLKSNQVGTYITPQDLNNNFVFNQLNTAGAVTLSGTNALSFTAGGKVNLNFTGTRIIAALGHNAGTRHLWLGRFGGHE